MEKLSSLQHVNASTLPAAVLVLMSKYAKTLKQSNETVIRLSSLRVFDDIHLSYIQAAKDEQLDIIYQQLLEQVNYYISAGLMVTNQEKKLTAGENHNKQRILNKYLPQAKANARAAA